MELLLLFAAGFIGLTIVARLLVPALRRGTDRLRAWTARRSRFPYAADTPCTYTGVGVGYDASGAGCGDYSGGGGTC